MKKIILSFFIFVSIFSFSSLAFGQGGGGEVNPLGGGGGEVDPSGGGGGDVVPNDSSQFTGLKNPIEVGSLPELVAKMLDVVLTIGVPIVAFFIIYSGFKFVLARGNEEKLKEAKQSILYTLLGAALLLGAWVLATAIDSIIDSIKSAA